MYSYTLSVFEKKIGKAIRFYALGEYGSRTYRPHYHLLIFGASSIDSSVITESWHYGFAYIGDVTIKSISYVCKYHVNRGHYKNNANPPFTTMSTKPGIGYKYVEKMRKFHENKLENSFYPDYEKKRKLPRYFKQKLYDKSELEQMKKIFEDNYSVEKVEAYNKKYPNSSYFKSQLDAIQSFEASFNEKSNFNNKL